MNDINPLTPLQRTALINRLAELWGNVPARHFIRNRVETIREDDPHFKALLDYARKGNDPDEQPDPQSGQ